MELLRLIVKKNLTLLVISVFLILLVFSLNLSIWYHIVPGWYYLILEARRGLNACLPLISALLIGLFIQSIAFTYEMFKTAVIKHKQDLDKLAETLLKRLTESCSFRSERDITGEKEWISLSCPTCEKYKEVRRKFGELVDDLGLHWDRVGELLSKLEELCKKIDRYNSDLKKSFSEISEEGQRLLEENLRNRDLRKPQGICEFLRMFLPELVLEDFRNKRVEPDKNTIEKFYGKEVERENMGIRVGPVPMRGIDEKEWYKEYLPLLVEVTYDLLNSFKEKLNMHVSEGNEMKNKVEELSKELKECLEDIRRSSVLPLGKLCKYIIQDR